MITGVADDDPSGISTYTITGATFGYQFLWTSLLTLPMNYAVQAICARIGVVTEQGLARIIARHYGRRWLFPVVLLLFVANVVNIGADIGAIAAAIALLVPVPARWLVVPLGITIALVEIVVPYAQLARILKVLTLIIFAYVLGAFAAHPDWAAALRATFLPEFGGGRTAIATIVAILGTTISPYLFFWQTAEEVEEEEEAGIHADTADPATIRSLVRDANLDVAGGMLLANAGFYFVVLTAAASLHAAGLTDVRTAAEAAEALRPLAGRGAALLFAFGIIGTGLLAVPVLAGSVAYATAELFDWQEGLGKTLQRAPQFYGVIALATLLGIGLTFSGLSEIRALYVAAIVNGIIAPVLLVFILTVAADRRIMGAYRVKWPLRVLGWVTAAVMAIAAVSLLVTLV